MGRAHRRGLRAIAFAGRRCLVLRQDTDEVVCLDLGTGEDLWEVGLRRFTGHLVVDGDVVLLGGRRGYTPLRAVDITTGGTLWEAEHGVRTVCPAAGCGGFLIGEPGGVRVRLIGRRDGRELRAWTLPSPFGDYDHEQGFTAVGGDRFVVRCGEDAVVRIEPSAAAVSGVVLAGHPLAPSAPRHVGGLLWLWERGSGVTVADPRDDHVEGGRAVTVGRRCRPGSAGRSRSGCRTGC